MACKNEPDSNPNTISVGHEAGSQAQADTIIRAAATPLKKEMAVQTDVERVCKASVQSVACQAACPVQNTSQAPLGLTAAQPSLADADKLVIMKMDLHIMRKMQLVKAERLVEAEEKNIKLAAVVKEYRARAWLSINRYDKYCPLWLTLLPPMLLLACRLWSTTHERGNPSLSCSFPAPDSLSFPLFYAAPCLQTKEYRAKEYRSRAWLACNRDDNSFSRNASQQASFRL
eukprot:gene4757-34507_t